MAGIFFTQIIFNPLFILLFIQGFILFFLFFLFLFVVHNTQANVTHLYGIIRISSKVHTQVISFFAPIKILSIFFQTNTKRNPFFRSRHLPRTHTMRRINSCFYIHKEKFEITHPQRCLIFKFKYITFLRHIFRKYSGCRPWITISCFYSTSTILM